LSVASSSAAAAALWKAGKTLFFERSFALFSMIFAAVSLQLQQITHY
jgi:hypothetical protein